MRMRVMSRTIQMILFIAIILVVGVVLAQESDTTAEPDALTDKLLVWTAPGEEPGRHLASQPGQVALMLLDGTLEPIMDVPQQTQRVVACGTEATSPDNRSFAFFVGGEDEGALYMMEGINPQPVTVAEGLNTMACIGGGMFQWSPNGERYAYLDFTDNYRNELSPYGRLYVNTTATHEQVGNYENVSAFDLTTDGVVLVNFFLNNDNEAVEIAVRLITPDSDQEIATLFADQTEDACLYTSANIETLGSGQLAMVLGYRCERGDFAGQTQWQLYLIDPSDRTATLAQTDASAGGFFAFSRTNNIYNAPQSDMFFFTLPDGVSNRTVSINRATPADTTPTPVIERFAVMPNLNNLPYDAVNHTPVLSSDGRWLAFTTETADRDAMLNIIDLTNPDLPPITLSAGSRGDTVAELLFTPDSQALYGVAGANNGGNNALFRIELASGAENRVARGRFEQGVLSPDGQQLALINWEVYDDEEPPYQLLSLIDTASGSNTTLFRGGEVVDGELQNAQFVVPLSWRQGAE